MRTPYLLTSLALIAILAAWMMPNQASSPIVDSLADCGECEKEDQQDDEETFIVDCGECEKEDQQDDEEAFLA